MGKSNRIKNKKIKIEKVSVKSFNLLIYILIGAFCVLYDKNSAFPASGSRWILLFLSSSLLPFFLISKYFKKLKNITLNFSIFQVTIFLFFMWLSISRFWTVDKLNFVEEWIQHSAVIILLVFFSFYAKKLNSKILIYLLGACTTFVSLIGLLQFYGLDRNILVQTAMPASTFVNKNLATPLLSLLLPFIYFPILFYKNNKVAIILTLELSLSITYLLVAATRSSWLGVFSSVIFFLFTLLNRNIRETFFKNILKLRFVNILVAILLTFLFITIGNSIKSTPLMTTTITSQIESLMDFDTDNFDIADKKAIKKGPKKSISPQKKLKKQKSEFLPKEKNRTLFNNSSKSIRMRIQKWLNSLEIVKDSPVLGIGLGSFTAVYPLYHKKVVVDEGYTGGYFYGGLHNDLYQYLVELGFIGLLIILTFLFLIFKMIFEIFKKDLSLFNFVFYLSTLIGIVGIFIDSCFNYPLRYATYLFILTIIIGKVYSKYYVLNANKIKIIYKINLKHLLSFLLIFFIILSVFTIIISYKKNMSDKKLHQAITMEKKGNLKQNWNYLRQSVNSWPYKSMNLLFATGICFENFKQEKTEQNYNDIVYYNNLAIANLPYHFIPNFIKLNLLFEKENWKKSKNITNDVKLLLKVTPKGSRKIQTLNSIAYLAYLKGEYEMSLQFNKKVLKFRPNNKRVKKSIQMLKKLIAKKKGNGENNE